MKNTCSDIPPLKQNNNCCNVKTVKSIYIDCNNNVFDEFQNYLGKGKIINGMLQIMK